MIIILILLILLVISFFFSSAETSIIGISKIKLRHMVQKGIKGAQNIQRLVSKIDKVIAAILIGNNIVNIAISSIVTGIFVQVYGYRWGVLASTFATTMVLLIFCEITPKILAAKHAEKVAIVTAPILEVVLKIFKPLVIFFIWVSHSILKLFGLSTSKKSPIITEEELRAMIEIGKEEGVLSEDQRKMLHRIFEFGDTQLTDVMVPKEKIVAVDVNTSSDNLLNIFVEEGHARLPVYKDHKENIVGIVYAQDLLYILREKGLFLLQDLLHEAAFIPSNTRVNDLLKRFQNEKMQIAIVVDKDKKLLGLVTLEDLIEEIVGEIEEKYFKGRKRK
ncbi:MAG: hemolysin family protein [Candidatus Omnitrophota bacterium]